MHGDTLISVEKNMNRVRDTGYVGDFDWWLWSTFWVLGSKTAQEGTIPIRNFDVVNVIIAFQLKVCEMDIDDMSLGNFDRFPLMKIVGVVVWEVGRRHLSACWKALGFLWQRT